MGLCSSSPKHHRPNPNELDISHFILLKVVGKGGFGKVNATQRLGMDGKVDPNYPIYAIKRMTKHSVAKKPTNISMVWTERDIMKSLHSPFLCSLVHAFQDSCELYFVMPFMQGGDLRYHLKQHGPLSEAHTRFYIAEVILGLQELHSLRIVYRDLKPDNILMDGEGHIRLSDFGISVKLKGGRFTKGRAGTPGYQAPEVLHRESYALAPDYWSLGILFYELLHGTRPWKTKFRKRPKRPGEKRKFRADPVSKKQADNIKFSRSLSGPCKKLIRALLTVDPRKRIGCEIKGHETLAPVMRHEFFADFDWRACRQQRIPPPFTPDLTKTNCSGNPALEDHLLDDPPIPATPAQNLHFKHWGYQVSLGPPESRVQRSEHTASSQLRSALQPPPTTDGDVPPAELSDDDARDLKTETGETKSFSEDLTNAPERKDVLSTLSTMNFDEKSLVSHSRVSVEFSIPEKTADIDMEIAISSEPGTPKRTNSRYGHGRQPSKAKKHTHTSSKYISTPGPQSPRVRPTSASMDQRGRLSSLRSSRSQSQRRSPSGPRFAPNRTSNASANGAQANA